MLTSIPQNFSSLLSQVAENLDIPDHLYEDAVLKYEDVGEWLGAPASPLKQYEPTIYPQGSFRLGTVVRPITDEDQFDIDLVCRLTIEKENTTQAGLKKLVGDRLKARQDLDAMLKECRRCWKLNFEQHFHMDVLPSLPNLERLPNGILLTDTELVRWQKSNPITYADWFRERMKVVFERKRLELAEVRKAEVQEVPEWQVKTPLQRAVQLLKRHRDIYFAKDLENRPVSIIITTLAAKAYGNQLDLYEGLERILRCMQSYIALKDGRYIVANPVEPEENFADKWNEKPARRVAFFKWLERAQADFLAAAEKRTLNESTAALAPALGMRATLTAAKSLGVAIAATALVPVRAQVPVPALGPASHCQRPTWPERLTARAKVRGEIYMANRRGKKLWDLSDRSVPKNVSLKFVLTTNVSAPYKVKWQVVNTGAEAATEGDLRGDFYDSDGGTTRWEHTKYVGTHWVEAFVVKDGICVARSGKVFIRVRG
ncbi:MAG TPA: nucleotidyltransferase [Clostridia bacterium]|nr:nucleotidyltransferase [Clostridia bacterium]